MLGKTFKGMTDEMLEWQTQKLLELETARDGYTVYVRPELVVEVAFNDVQASPQYPGGLTLRFARVKRYRPDKGPDMADTIATVRELHRRGGGAGWAGASVGGRPRAVARISPGRAGPLSLVDGRSNGTGVESRDQPSGGRHVSHYYRPSPALRRVARFPGRGPRRVRVDRTWQPRAQSLRHHQI